MVVLGTAFNSEASEHLKALLAYTFVTPFDISGMNHSPLRAEQHFRQAWANCKLPQFLLVFRRWLRSCASLADY